MCAPHNHLFCVCTELGPRSGLSGGFHSAGGHTCPQAGLGFLLAVSLTSLFPCYFSSSFFEDDRITIHVSFPLVPLEAEMDPSSYKAPPPPRNPPPPPPVPHPGALACHPPAHQAESVSPSPESTPACDFTRPGERGGRCPKPRDRGLKGLWDFVLFFSHGSLGRALRGRRPRGDPPGQLDDTRRGGDSGVPWPSL